MTRGVLLFASNNDAISYTDIAEECAKRCQRYLQVPVSVVSSTPDQIKNKAVFDNIISYTDKTAYSLRDFKNKDQSVVSEWKNLSRSDAWNLTPYDETLVIDVDYFLFTDKLKYCFEQSSDLVISKLSQDLSYWRDQSEFKSFGLIKNDFYWATVFFFRKTSQTKIFFNLISHIRDNWIYYKQQYQFSSRLYRNDFSFSIAVGMLKDIAVELPFPLCYITDQDTVISINESCCKVLIQRPHGKEIISDIRDLDIHIMNKLALKELLNV
jgi:hypothetical protein